MFHRAVDLQFKDGTMIEVTFQDGKVFGYNMAKLYEKYPSLRALDDEEFFKTGKLMGLGIIWNDELDIETETIYEEGVFLRMARVPINYSVGNAVASARTKKGMSQKELSEASGIDQSDLSKIERGAANPSVNTLSRIAEAMDVELNITMK